MDTVQHQPRPPQPYEGKHRAPADRPTVRVTDLTYKAKHAKDES